MKKLASVFSMCLFLATVNSIDVKAQSSTPEAYYLGEWEFTVPGTEVGTLNMVLSIEKEEDTFTGTMGDPALGFKFQLDSFSLSDSILSARASLQSAGIVMPVKLIKRSESMATVDMDGSTFTANRQDD